MVDNLSSERKSRKMAVLATPNKSCYVIKKDCASQILESKTDANRMKEIKENANLFTTNNLRIKAK